MWHQLLLYLGVALAIQWSAAAIAGSPDDDAAVARFNAAVDEAIALRAAGETADALGAFEEALEAIRDRSGPVFDKGRSVVWYHQAQLLVALERYEEARAVLTLLLNSPGLAEGERATVAERLREIEAKLDERAAAQRPARLHIRVEGPPKEHPVDIRVDGVAVGRAPVVVERPPGRYRVAVSADGFYPKWFSVELPPGTELRRTVELERNDLSGTRFWGWTAVGAGVALIGGATALYVDARNTMDEATREGLPFPTAVARRAAGEDQAVGSFVMYAAGGVAVATGLVLVLLADSPMEGDDEPGRGAPSVSVGLGSVLWSGSF